MHMETGLNCSSCSHQARGRVFAKQIKCAFYFSACVCCGITGDQMTLQSVRIQMQICFCVENGVTRWKTRKMNCVRTIKWNISVSLNACVPMFSPWFALYPKYFRAELLTGWVCVCVCADVANRATQHTTLASLLHIFFCYARESQLAAVAVVVVVEHEVPLGLPRVFYFMNDFWRVHAIFYYSAEYNMTNYR